MRYKLRNKGRKFFYWTALLFCTTIHVYAQWEPVKIYGADAYELVSAGNGKIFAATGGGLYYSADNGSSWLKKEISDVRSVADINRTYDLLQNAYLMFRGQSVTGNSVYFRSEDNGETWAKITDSTDYLSKGITSKIVLGNVIAAGIYESGIYVSTDSGKNFSPAYGMYLNSPNQFRILPTGEIISTGEDSEVIHSLDSGKTWSRYDLEDLDTNALRNLFFFGDTMILLSGQFLYRSTDFGKSWNAEFVSYQFQSGSEFLASDGTLYMSIETKGEIFPARLKLGAATIEIMPKGYSHAPVSSFAEINGTIFMPSRGMIYRLAADGETWEYSASGITADMYEFVEGDNGQVFIDNYIDVFQKTDTGDWRSLRQYFRKNTLSVADMLVTKEGTLLAGTYQKNIYRIEKNSEKAEIFDRSQYIGGFVQGKSGRITGLLGNFGLIESTDDGKSWKNTISFQNYSNEFPSLDMIAENSKGERFVASILTGNLAKISSTASAATMLMSDASINEIKISSDDALYIASRKHGLLFSSNSGQNLENITPTAVSTKFINSVAIGIHGEIFCASDRGVYRSDDKGKSWNLIGFGGDVITKIALDRQGLLYAQVRGKGAFVSAQISDIEDTQDQKQMNIHINPQISDNAVALSYSVEKENFVRISVINSVGEEIFLIKNEKQNEGKYMQKIYLKDYSQGIYFCKVSIGNETVMKKIIIAR